MLVLSRRTNQSIIIGDNIEVMIVEIQGDQVKVGIKAPKEITVHRKEIFEQIQRANIEAAKGSQPDFIKTGTEILRSEKK